MKTFKTIIMVETKVGSGDWISVEVDAMPLTEHFCLAMGKEKKYGVLRTLTHIPTGWRLTNRFYYTKKEALPRAKALEKLPINWNSANTKDYASIPRDIMDQVYTIIYPEGKPTTDSSMQIG